MKRGPFVLAAAAALAVRQPAAAQTDIAPLIARLFTNPTIDQQWFSPAFLQAIHIEQMRSIVAALVATLGAYRGIAPNDAHYTVTFARGSVQASATAGSDGAFTALLFSRMQSDAAAQRIAALFRTTSVPAEWFSGSFLQTVPIAQVRTGLGQIEQQFGAYVGAEPAHDGSYTLSFANGKLACVVFLDKDGKLEDLTFPP